MRDRPSHTASWVAVARWLGRTLPSGARLIDDPYGISFAQGAIGTFAKITPALAGRMLHPLVLHMQVRTRAIDDVLRTFVKTGGKQVVVLGAGYDCRAARLASDLADVVVYEVDHPATQARKRETLARAQAPTASVHYVPWNFEERALRELPAALAAEGFQVAAPSLTIWEGVTMYLSDEAIEASVGAMSAYAAPGSLVVITYLDRAALDQPSLSRRIVGGVVASSGEPFRFGWVPEELPVWCQTRGFNVVWDRSALDLAHNMMPPELASSRILAEQRMVLVRRAAT